MLPSESLPIGLLYALDVVMFVTGKSREDAGKVSRHLTDESLF